MTRIEASLRAKQKPQALSYLRSRKTLEELLVRRMGSLETLHGVLVKLEQAAGDVEVSLSLPFLLICVRGRERKRREF